MLNHITIMGRLTKDVELRRTDKGTAVASFTLAVDRDFSKENKTDFFNCVAWDKKGEFIANYFSKGRMIVVSGRLENREWMDKNNNKRTTAEIIVENAYFGDSKKDSATDNNVCDTNFGEAGWTPMEADGDVLPF